MTNNNALCPNCYNGKVVKVKNLDEEDSFYCESCFTEIDIKTKEEM